MLAKFRTAMAGRQIARPGEILDLPNAEARAHIEGGNAVAPDEIETATFRAREKAIAEKKARQEKETRQPQETR